VKRAALRGAAGKLDSKSTRAQPTDQPGRPAHVPTAKTRKKVRLLSALGFTVAEIVLLLDTTEATLRKHYRHEMRVGTLEADASVLQNIFRIATGKGPEATRAAIFWAKVRRRWHEVQRVIHGFDPAMVSVFVNSITSALRRMLPQTCPSCHAPLGLHGTLAKELHRISQKMVAKLPEVEVVDMPRPELASDGVDAEPETEAAA
jgi:hypothetical protein